MALTYVKYWNTSTGVDGGDVTVSGISVATGDVVLALWVNAGYASGDALTVSSTGGLLSSWSNRATVAVADNCHAAAFFATAIGSGAITVTVASNGSFPKPGSLAVIVHTGAHATDPAPTGNVFSGSGATDVGQSITPTASGSCLWMICGDWAQTNSYVARTDNTIDNTHDVAGEYTSALIRPTTNPRTDANSFTIGETDTSGSIAWVALEVQADGGSPPPAERVVTATVSVSMGV